MTELAINDKVRVRHIDACNLVIHFEGKIIEHNGKYWKVDVGGVRLIVQEEALTRLD